MSHIFGIDNELTEQEVSEVSGGFFGLKDRNEYTTLALGEEGGDGGLDCPIATTLAVGEEGGGDYTTLAIGEEGGSPE